MNIQQALRATVFGRVENTEDDVRRYFAPDYTQVTDGVESSYDEFVAHIRHVRSEVVDGELTVHEAALEGSVVADRHSVRVRTRDGRESTLEVLLVGTLAADGRLHRVVETTRQIDGDPALAAIGSATA